MGVHHFRRIKLAGLSTDITMRKLLFAIMLPLYAFGQDSATHTFRLDTFGIDSFFLVEIYTQPQGGQPRAIETEYPIYMTDTSQLSSYILSMQAEYAAISAQGLELAKRKAAWDYRYNRVICLRDSVFYGASCTGVGSRMAKAPPVESSTVLDSMDTRIKYLVVELEQEGYIVIDQETQGFWVVYPTGGFDWITGVEQAKQSGTILYRNGATGELKKPKAKKTTTKKKKQ